LCKKSSRWPERFSKKITPERGRLPHPAAKGERFLAVAGHFLSLLDIAKILKKRLGTSARRVPTRQLPGWLVRLAAIWIPAVRAMAPELGKIKNSTNEKARSLLGWAPRSNEEAIVATTESLLRLGLLKGNAKRFFSRRH
jgi:nucleoside-diphosphate-sugar epimerase